MRKLLLFLALSVFSPVLFAQTSTGPKIPVFVGGVQGTTYWTQGNQMLRMLQALVQPNVINLTTTTPPVNPSNGDTYVVGVSATGVWTGKDNQIAYWSTDNPQVPGGEWEYWVPLKGWLVTDRSTTPPTIYVFNGTIWSAFGSSFSTAGQSWFLGGQSFAPVDTGSGSQISAGSNTVVAVQLTLAAAYTISKLGAFQVTGTASANFFSAAIYSADGNTKLIDAGTNAFPVQNSQIYTQVSLGSPVTLQPGTYLFAWACTVSGCGSTLAHAQLTWFAQALNGISFGGGQTGTTHIGTAAHPMSGGAMPSTLGTITPVDHTIGWSVPVVIFLP